MCDQQRMRRSRLATQTRRRQRLKVCFPDTTAVAKPLLANKHASQIRADSYVSSGRHRSSGSMHLFDTVRAVRVWSSIIIKDNKTAGLQSRREALCDHPLCTAHAATLDQIDQLNSPWSKDGNLLLCFSNLVHVWPASPRGNLLQSLPKLNTNVWPCLMSVFSHREWRKFSPHITCISLTSGSFVRVNSHAALRLYLGTVVPWDTC